LKKGTLNFLTPFADFKSSCRFSFHGQEHFRRFISDRFLFKLSHRPMGWDAMGAKRRSSQTARMLRRNDNESWKRKNWFYGLFLDRSRRGTHRAAMAEREREKKLK
jgi:hypothetical protein